MNIMLGQTLELKLETFFWNKSDCKFQWLWLSGLEWDLDESLFLFKLKLAQWHPVNGMMTLIVSWIVLYQPPFIWAKSRDGQGVWGALRGQSISLFKWM